MMILSIYFVKVDFKLGMVLSLLELSLVNKLGISVVGGFIVS